MHGRTGGARPSGRNTTEPAYRIPIAEARLIGAERTIGLAAFAGITGR